MYLTKPHIWKSNHTEVTTWLNALCIIVICYNPPGFYRDLKSELNGIWWRKSPCILWVFRENYLCHPFGIKYYLDLLYWPEDTIYRLPLGFLRNSYYTFQGTIVQILPTIKDARSAYTLKYWKWLGVGWEPVNPQRLGPGTKLPVWPGCTHKNCFFFTQFVLNLFQIWVQDFWSLSRSHLQSPGHPLIYFSWANLIKMAVHHISPRIKEEHTLQNRFYLLKHPSIYFDFIRDRGERSPDVHNSQHWVRPKAGARSCLWISHVDSRNLSNWSIRSGLESQWILVVNPSRHISSKLALTLQVELQPIYSGMGGWCFTWQLKSYVK